MTLFHRPASHDIAFLPAMHCSVRHCPRRSGALTSATARLLSRAQSNRMAHIRSEALRPLHAPLCWPGKSCSFLMHAFVCLGLPVALTIVYGQCIVPNSSKPILRHKSTRFPLDDMFLLLQCPFVFAESGSRAPVICACKYIIRECVCASVRGGV